MSGPFLQAEVEDWQTAYRWPVSSVRDARAKVAKLDEAGWEALRGCAHLLTVLLSAMAMVALLINPLIVWARTRRNPYPLVFTALRESGVTAFFTRSSAANIPVNLALCERLDLEKDTYSMSIP